MENLKEHCSKVPSFAGFWYELLFFMYYKQQKSSGLTICCNANWKSTPTRNSRRNTTVKHKLRAKSPYCWCFELFTGNRWHVFADIHTDLTTKVWRPLKFVWLWAPKNSKVRCNVSFFTYYKHLFGIGSSFQNISLLYVSPTAKDVNLLWKLNQQISKLSIIFKKIWSTACYQNVSTLFNGYIVECIQNTDKVECIQNTDKCT